jgi:hypothetical protein
VRYTLERGVSGIYTYAQFSHEASYPAAGEGESRFIAPFSARISCPVSSPRLYIHYHTRSVSLFLFTRPDPPLGAR